MLKFSQLCSLSKVQWVNTNNLRTEQDCKHDFLLKIFILKSFFFMPPFSIVLKGCTKNRWKNCNLVTKSFKPLLDSKVKKTWEARVFRERRWNEVSESKKEMMLLRRKRIQEGSKRTSFWWEGCHDIFDPDRWRVKTKIWLFHNFYPHGIEILWWKSQRKS